MRVKNTRYSPTCVLFASISVIFIVTVILNFSLLAKGKATRAKLILNSLLNQFFLDQCNCPAVEQKNEIKPRKRLLSNKHRLALLVPYRERFEELLKFTPDITAFLKKQNLNFDVFILNQVDQNRFNRASLINAGFLQVKNDYDYIAMHDVDLLPLNPNLSYSYPIRPVHLAAPHLHPRYHYEKFIGGIFLINR